LTDGLSANHYWCPLCGYTEEVGPAAPWMSLRFIVCRNCTTEEQLASGPVTFMLAEPPGVQEGLDR
jgi:hypothetical protein